MGATSELIYLYNDWYFSITIHTSVCVKHSALNGYNKYNRQCNNEVYLHVYTCLATHRAWHHFTLRECFYGNFMLPATMNSTSSSHTVPDILVRL